MNSAKHIKLNMGQRLVVAAFASLALTLLLSTACLAQNPPVTASPETITDSAKPQSVTLTINDAGGKPDAVTTGKVINVKVGDILTSQFTPNPPQGKITFTPPPNLSGQQQVQLLDTDSNPVTDSTGKPLVGPTLKYPNPILTPTPNPADFDARSRVERQNVLSKQGWYQGIVLVAFIFMLGAFIFTITRGILRSRSTFRNPLGLPVGSLRAILAYTLVAFLGFYVLTSLLTVSVFAPPDFLLGIVATVVGFYFGSRNDEGGGAADERVGIVRGIVRKDTPGSGTLVSGALVKFRREDGTEPYSRLTDVDGRFVLQGAKPGKYKVTATITSPAASGQLDITITEGTDQEIEITIKSATSAATGGTTGGQGGGTG
jgi:hypothetical protein